MSFSKKGFHKYSLKSSSSIKNELKIPSKCPRTFALLQVRSNSLTQLPSREPHESKEDGGSNSSVRERLDVGCNFRATNIEKGHSDKKRGLEEQLDGKGETLSATPPFQNEDQGTHRAKRSTSLTEKVPRSLTNDDHVGSISQELRSSSEELTIDGEKFRVISSVEGDVYLNMESEMTLTQSLLEDNDWVRSRLEKSATQSELARELKLRDVKGCCIDVEVSCCTSVAVESSNNESNSKFVEFGGPKSQQSEVYRTFNSSPVSDAFHLKATGRLIDDERRRMGTIETPPLYYRRSTERREEKFESLQDQLLESQQRSAEGSLSNQRRGDEKSEEGTNRHQGRAEEGVTEQNKVLYRQRSRETKEENKGILESPILKSEQRKRASTEKPPLYYRRSTESREGNFDLLRDQLESRQKSSEGSLLYQRRGAKKVDEENAICFQGQAAEIECKEKNATSHRMLGSEQRKVGSSEKPPLYYRRSTERREDRSDLLQDSILESQQRIVEKSERSLCHWKPTKINETERQQNVELQRNRNDSGKENEDAMKVKPSKGESHSRKPDAVAETKEGFIFPSLGPEQVSIASPPSSVAKKKHLDVERNYLITVSLDELDSSGSQLTSYEALHAIGQLSPVTCEGLEGQEKVSSEKREEKEGGEMEKGIRKDENEKSYDSKSLDELVNLRSRLEAKLFSQNDLSYGENEDHIPPQGESHSEAMAETKEGFILASPPVATKKCLDVEGNYLITSYEALYAVAQLSPVMCDRLEWQEKVSSGKQEREERIRKDANEERSSHDSKPLDEVLNLRPMFDAELSSQNDLSSPENDTSTATHQQVGIAPEHINDKVSVPEKISDFCESLVSIGETKRVSQFFHTFCDVADRVTSDPSTNLLPPSSKSNVSSEIQFVDSTQASALEGTTESTTSYEGEATTKAGVSSEEVIAKCEIASSWTAVITKLKPITAGKSSASIAEDRMTPKASTPNNGSKTGTNYASPSTGSTEPANSGVETSKTGTASSGSKTNTKSASCSTTAEASEVDSSSTGGKTNTESASCSTTTEASVVDSSSTARKAFTKSASCSTTAEASEVDSYSTARKAFTKSASCSTTAETSEVDSSSTGGKTNTKSAFSSTGAKISKTGSPSTGNKIGAKPTSNAEAKNICKSATPSTGRGADEKSGSSNTTTETTTPAETVIKYNDSVLLQTNPPTSLATVSNVSSPTNASSPRLEKHDKYALTREEQADIDAYQPEMKLLLKLDSAKNRHAYVKKKWGISNPTTIHRNLSFFDASVKMAARNDNPRKRKRLLDTPSTEVTAHPIKRQKTLSMVYQQKFQDKERIYEEGAKEEVKRIYWNFLFTLQQYLEACGAAHCMYRILQRLDLLQEVIDHGFNIVGDTLMPWYQIDSFLQRAHPIREYENMLKKRLERIHEYTQLKKYRNLLEEVKSVEDYYQETILTNEVCFIDDTQEKENEIVESLVRNMANSY